MVYLNCLGDICGFTVLCRVCNHKEELGKEEQIKEERAEKARKHLKAIETEFSGEILHSIENTKVYSPDSFGGGDFPVAKHKTTEYSICDLDSVSAAYKYGKEGKTTGILNFASYKHPGGGWIIGAMAQEEALCSESTLYPVLKAQQSFYDQNVQNMNKGLYINRALYSPDVVFTHDNKVRTFDVITCAAPN